MPKNNTYNNSYYTTISILVGLLLLLYAYQIHRYGGLRGYLDHRLEQKKQRYDAIYNLVNG